MDATPVTPVNAATVPSNTLLEPASATPAHTLAELDKPVYKAPSNPSTGTAKTTGIANTATSYAHKAGRVAGQVVAEVVEVVSTVGKKVGISGSGQKAAPANTTTTTTASASSLPRRSFEIAKDQANKVYEITKDTVVAAVEGAKTGYVEKKRDSSKERKDASASAMSTDTI